MNTDCLQKKKRRMADLPLAVAPPLQPFLQCNSAGTMDVEDGIYNFLSAQLPTTTEDHNTTSQSHFYTRHTDNNDNSSFENLTNNYVNHKNILHAHAQSVPVKPEWFQKGYNVEKLLKEAEGLDWSQDAGTMLESNDNTEFNNGNHSM